jgi:basic membrane protein A and related proteins
MTRQTFLGHFPPRASSRRGRARPRPADPAAHAAAQAPLKVAGIYTVPVEQQWVSRIHIAAEAAKAAGEIDYTFTENVANTDYPASCANTPNRAPAHRGRDLRGRAGGARGRGGIPERRLPDGLVLHARRRGEPEPRRLRQLHPGRGLSHRHRCRFHDETGNVGMVGGFPIPEVNRLMHAFMAGVREMRPDATFQVSFIGSWFDPPKAKETAFAMIEAGADMMYAERFGVSDAAQERGVLAIGNVIDTQPDYPETVVVSALWHFEPTMNAAIANVKAGTFAADNYGVYSYMKNGGCSISPLGTFEGKVPEAAMALVAERQAAILDGSFTVEINDSEPTSSS